MLESPGKFPKIREWPHMFFTIVELAILNATKCLNNLIPFSTCSSFQSDIPYHTVRDC